MAGLPQRKDTSTLDIERTERYDYVSPTARTDAEEASTRRLLSPATDFTIIMVHLLLLVLLLCSSFLVMGILVFIALILIGTTVTLLFF